MNFLRELVVCFWYIEFCHFDCCEAPDVKIIHVQDIFLARQQHRLKLEEELFDELIFLFRSPERIIQRSQTTIPKFKGHSKKSKKGRKKKKKKERKVTFSF